MDSAVTRHQARLIILARTAFKNIPVVNYSVNGLVKGTLKILGKPSWLRAFNSGHHAPSFQSELGVQIFTRTVQKKPQFST